MITFLAVIMMTQFTNEVESIHVDITGVLRHEISGFYFNTKYGKVHLRDNRNLEFGNKLRAGINRKVSVRGKPVIMFGIINRIFIDLTEVRLE